MTQENLQGGSQIIPTLVHESGARMTRSRTCLPRLKRQK